MRVLVLLLLWCFTSPALAVIEHCQLKIVNGVATPTTIPQGWFANSSAPHDGSPVELNWNTSGIHHYGIFHWVPSQFNAGKPAWVGVDKEHAFVFYLDNPCLFWRPVPAGTSASNYTTPDGKTWRQRLCEAGHKEHCPVGNLAK